MDIHLDPVARGRLDADASEAYIKDIWDLPKAPELVYNAVLTRVWTMVSQRHTAEELWGWHHLLRTLRHWAGRSGKEGLAERFQSLADMVSISINMSGRAPLAELVNRVSERCVLETLADAPEDGLTQGEIRTATGRQEGAVTHIMDLLALAGAVETAGFAEPVRITAVGRAALRAHQGTS